MGSECHLVSSEGIQLYARLISLSCIPATTQLKSVWQIYVRVKMMAFIAIKPQKNEKKKKKRSRGGGGMGSPCPHQRLR